MKYVYLFESCSQDRKCRLMTNRRMAERLARTHGGHVYRMSYGLYKDGRTPYGWDRNTFLIQSDQIF